MRVLLVSDEREGLAPLLRLKGHEVRSAGDLTAAAAALREEAFAAIVADWRLPDGTAGALLAGSEVPVIAVSARPEECREAVDLVAVLTKPVLPTRLLEVLATLATADTEAAASASPFAGVPVDVREVLDRAMALLGDRSVRVIDDGQFVTLQARWPGDAARPQFERLGGDLRILSADGGPRLEQRWCRDGRPEASMPVVPATGPWPLEDRLGVDFHDTRCDLDEFERHVDRACAWRADGRQVHFLNVPRHLIAAMESAGRMADLPMKERIGPRTPAAVQDHWS